MPSGAIQSADHLLLERGIEQIVNCRCWFVAWHEALAEIACEVVVSRGGARLHNAADGAGESLLHFQSRKHLDDCCHLSLRQFVVAPTSPIQRDACCAQGDLCLLVEARSEERRV